MAWFKYRDMSTGGYEKSDYGTIFVEAHDEYKANDIFESELDLDPYGVACDCCGNDFWVSEVEADYVEGYAQREDVLVIKKEAV
ncbi:hypothetical protein RY279_06645 [Bacillus velezensis]|uniref:DUF7296 family protein n=1 Tax=Bacillus velezensis TaxID=492670 RepID=UPI00146AC145|nr:hypothetical protein [Bacillus velezensis]MBW7977996.1 hypothetical protein [Bacillus velezensis]MDP1503105.1 hypothetical protein [Bacillus velezensis]MDP1506964.1 hypothetical protein [Bacillus velezensis]NMW10814.1 hypothetical protein [Bacillus velezensis]